LEVLRCGVGTRLEVLTPTLASMEYAWASVIMVLGFRGGRRGLPQIFCLSRAKISAHRQHSKQGGPIHYQPVQ
jgi:hypothetical protein